MKLEIKLTQAKRMQRAYARVAGALLLWLIVTGLGAGLIVSRIAGSGTFVEIAKRVVASERLYRVGLSIQVIEIVSAILFALTMSATLKPVNRFLAQLAMIFSLQDTFLAGVVRMSGFVRLHLYTSSQTVGADTTSAQALSDLMRAIAVATENIGGISFGISLFLFFYLFFKSRYIPRILSALGLFASAIWTVLYLAGLIFPEPRAVFLYICFPPMGVAIIVTGFWLMLFAIKNQGGSDSYTPSRRANPV